jgi:hypothetical protein
MISSRGHIRVSAPLAGLFLSVAAAFLVSCVPVNPGGGSGGGTCGSQITDPDEVLAGCLIDKDGGPAIGARVQAFQIGSKASAKRSAVGDTDASDLELTRSGKLVYTDGTGRYSFKKVLGEGSYDLLFQSVSAIQGKDSLDTAYALHPDIYVSKSYLFLDKDFLSKRGYIVGVLEDKSSLDPIVGATCFVPGKPFGDTSDIHGFRWSMPAGIYSVVCRYPPYQDAMFEKITVISGQDADVHLQMGMKDDTSHDFAPAYLTASYDSLSGVVHLTWPAMDFRGFHGYEVRRIDPTKFPDVVFFHPEDSSFDDLVYTTRADTIPKRLYYAVTCIRTNTSIRDWTPAVVDVKPPPIVGADIELGLVPADTSHADTSNTVVVGDTARIWSRFENHLRINTELAWSAQRPVDDTFAWVEDYSQVRKIRALSGTDTLAYLCKSPGKVKIKLTVTDEQGISNTSYLRFNVVAADTTATIAR